uniref:Uncharacterized protein LOC101498714 n=1 Tax=Cicer arietinum TaxID=3827 RepID=A0A1S2XUN1_CICAR|nr:uncharacterized protein LOC101498714 [Cicer arietinum]
MYDFTTNAVTSTTNPPLESPSPLIRRHNSISAVTPNKLPPPATKPPMRTSSLDLELFLLKSPFTSYTSLKDMLPSPHTAINSPTASSASSAAINSGYEISIRNRLVKQAAWAYLQPMSSSPGNSTAPNFLRRLCHSLSTFCHNLVSGLTRIFRRILHAFSGQVRT